MTVLTVDQHLPTICTEIFIIGEMFPTLDTRFHYVRLTSLRRTNKKPFLSLQYKFAQKLIKQPFDVDLVVS